MNRTIPDVSIIIPCFNSRETIVETVRSALAQEAVATEIIVVDDGSTDGTRECLQEAGLLGRIHYEVQANQGMSVARNRGIDLARGRFYCFLDSDDLLKPSFAREMIDALGREECRIGYSDYQYFFDAPERPQLYIRYPTYSGWVQGKIISEHFVPTTGVVLVSREAVGATRFEPALRNTQDWLFWAELMVRERVCFHPKILIEIRFRTNSLSKGKQKLARAVVQTLEHIEPLLDTYRSPLGKRDIGMYYYRFTSALIEAREFRRALTTWKKCAFGSAGIVVHAKLTAKMILEILNLRQRVDLALWNLRLRRAGPS